MAASTPWRLGRFAVFVLPFLFISAAVLSVAAEDAALNLDQVKGIEHFDGPPAARDLLQKNGFVVVPRFYHQIFSPYIRKGDSLPPFITTDSLHRTFHVIFEEQIKKVETAFAPQALHLSLAMSRNVHLLVADQSSKNVNDNPGPLAEGYFAVAIRLLGGERTVEGPLADAVEAELKLIEAAGVVAVSPLFGYPIDYSQFKPRGFYTDTPLLQRYFRAMSWYGDAAFRLVSDRETQVAMLIAQAFAADEAARLTWSKIAHTYDCLIAPPDDLTPEEYARIVETMANKEMEDPLAAFRARARKLRDPKINSMVLPPDQMPR